VLQPYAHTHLFFALLKPAYVGWLTCVHCAFCPCTRMSQGRGASSTLQPLWLPSQTHAQKRCRSARPEDLPHSCSYCLLQLSLAFQSQSQGFFVVTRSGFCNAATSKSGERERKRVVSPCISSAPPQQIAPASTAMASLSLRAVSALLLVLALVSSSAAGKPFDKKPRNCNMGRRLEPTLVCGGVCAPVALTLLFSHFPCRAQADAGCKPFSCAGRHHIRCASTLPIALRRRQLAARCAKAQEP
jgi:hypothetical protein